MASLYNPNIRQRVVCETEHWFEAEPTAIYGSQAYLFTRQAATLVTERWDEIAGMQDIKMSRLAALLGLIYYHTPSLVQHVGRESAWGGKFHWTQDFNPAFRNPQKRAEVKI
jgi:hypothetical protein